MALGLRESRKLTNMVNKLMNRPKQNNVYYKKVDNNVQRTYYYQAAVYSTPPNNGIGTMY